MAPTVLVTGFPGFVGSQLVRTLAAARPDDVFALLVEARFEEVAAGLCREIEEAVPGFRGRWQLVVGDIREADLGIPVASLTDLRVSLRTVWHVAAIYDLAVPEGLAREVNVTGTERVLDFCESLDRLDRLCHVSSIVTAGDREGVVLESELDAGQSFRNHYESTKFESEKRVRERGGRLPIVVFRPAVVVGHSQTGEIPKADGPYLMVKAIQRTPRWLPYAHVGRGTSYMNIVPVDFLVDAMVHIAPQDDALGRTFHIADPEPLELKDFVNLTLRTFGRAPATTVLPKATVDRALRIGLVRRLTGLPRESVDYVDQDVLFDLSNTREALGDALPFPRVAEYWPRLARWMAEHPEI